MSCAVLAAGEPDAARAGEDVIETGHVALGVAVKHEAYVGVARFTRNDTAEQVASARLQRFPQQATLERLQRDLQPIRSVVDKVRLPQQIRPVCADVVGK